MPAYREAKTVVSELLFKGLYKSFSNSCFLVEGFELIAFITSTVAANRTHIEHSIAVFHKRAAFYGDVQVSDVVQAEVDKLFQFLFAQEILEAFLLEELTLLHCVQSILREAVVCVINDLFGQLLCHFGEVTSRHDTEVDATSPHLGQRFEHLRLDSLAGRSEGHVDIE